MQRFIPAEGFAAEIERVTREGAVIEDFSHGRLVRGLPTPWNSKVLYVAKSGMHADCQALVGALKKTGHVLSICGQVESCAALIIDEPSSACLAALREIVLSSS